LRIAALLAFQRLVDDGEALPDSLMSVSPSRSVG
jgi:hypothetical protein